MLLVTTDQIEGKKLMPLGICKGSTVQSKHIGKDFMAGLRNIVGGEITAYAEMMDEARGIATRRMVEEAQRMGADAVVAMRYATSAIMQSAAEVMAYGTAVKFIQ
ncbi:MAG: YbjQ family protein [Lachnospiraceae bacterium]|nr:YbjQ family protein [Lachnospiraceae bacterium]